jgi:hypothetical protein
MASFALVATVDPKAASDVGFRLRTVPPFDLPQEGIAGHQAFLGPEHAAFVFWGSDPEGALVRASGHADVRQRLGEAIEGMRMPRRLDAVFEWVAPGHRARPGGRSVAVVARGVESRPDPDASPMRALVDRLGAGLERARVFAGEGVAVFVFERNSEASDATELLSLAALRDAAPVVPLRPLEGLDETYWFEAGDQLSPRPSRGILEADEAVRS